ncbi:MAG TPA: Lsr2 family protein [Streptosporangiaceae bacterium]
MAQRTQIVFTDDLDGGPADTTVSFAVDGTAYEIDLSAAHAEEFRVALQPYVAAARRVGSSSKRAAKAGRSGGPNPSAVREWAKTEGIKVSDRGRVPAELIVKFQAANPR